ncbi:MAG: hypothetical protein OXC07_01860, partial [Kistimonas sp.]|nr:hypothetical protein [Kistimonas sp.]
SRLICTPSRISACTPSRSFSYLCIVSQAHPSAVIRQLPLMVHLWSIYGPLRDAPRIGEDMKKNPLQARDPSHMRY